MENICTELRTSTEHSSFAVGTESLEGMSLIAVVPQNLEFSCGTDGRVLGHDYTR